MRHDEKMPPPPRPWSQFAAKDSSKSANDFALLRRLPFRAPLPFDFFFVCIVKVMRSPNAWKRLRPTPPSTSRLADHTHRDCVSWCDFSVCLNTETASHLERRLCQANR